MKLLEVSELYNLISRGSENVTSRKQSKQLRKVAMQSVSSGQGFTKLAFDTRRIDQETEYNPRRNLQNYNRSEAFLSEAISQKIIHFAKLRKVLVGLKAIYGKEHEWQDSNARVLLSTLDNGLRTLTKDGDYTESQPGVGSFDYIEELMHVRYRLGFDDLAKMSETDLKKAILSKDEELIRKDVSDALEITKHDVAKQGYDTLMEKLFSISGTPSADQPVIERSITITIRDSFPNKLPDKKG
jgi:hypothetical protein